MAADLTFCKTYVKAKFGLLSGSQPIPHEKGNERGGGRDEPERGNRDVPPASYRDVHRGASRKLRDLTRS
jgi:hypothetical protein